MQTQFHNIMDYRAYVIQLRELLHFYILMKFIAQQLDHYLYTLTTKIMRNLQQNSQNKGNKIEMINN